MRTSIPVPDGGADGGTRRSARRYVLEVAPADELSWGDVVDESQVVVQMRREEKSLEGFPEETGR